MTDKKESYTKGQEPHITPARVVVDVNPADYPTLVVSALVEFDYHEDPRKVPPGDIYYAQKRVRVDERFMPTYLHRRAAVFEALRKIFQEFSRDARYIAENPNND